MRDGNSVGLSGHLPRLEGLRAVAVSFVVFDHLCVSGYLPVYQTIVDMGNLGVRILFEMSGFIITVLMLNEKERSGGLCLRAFYIRRGFRILPLLIRYLVLIVAESVVADHTPSFRDSCAVLTFNTDYGTPSSIEFSHL
jgi:peptidoglycan/LPS O-acetylase OafA/YrhL